MLNLPCPRFSSYSTTARYPLLYYTDICFAEGIVLTDQNGFQSFLAFSGADVTLTTFCSCESEIQHAAFALSLCCALAANAGVFDKKYPDVCERRTLISAPRLPFENTLRGRDSTPFCPAETFTEMLLKGQFTQ